MDIVFDDQTELLTKDGFKKYQDVNIGDTCLTMRKDNSKLEWNTVNKKFVYDF